MVVQPWYISHMTLGWLSHFPISLYLCVCSVEYGTHMTSLYYVTEMTPTTAYFILWKGHFPLLLASVETRLQSARILLKVALCLHSFLPPIRPILFWGYVILGTAPGYSLFGKVKNPKEGCQLSLLKFFWPAALVTLKKLFLLFTYLESRV